MSATILSAEKNLLLAVRNRLRTELAIDDAGWNNDRVQIECDEQANATAGKVCYVVTPGPMSAGEAHNGSGGVFDFYYAVNVAVAVRAAEVPRDRTREVFVGNLGALANLLDKVIGIIDFRYDVMNAANTLILAETTNAQGFEYPLRLTGMDPRPQIVPASFFGGKDNERGGLKRTLNFGKARRTTYRTET